MFYLVRLTRCYELEVRKHLTAGTNGNAGSLCFCQNQDPFTVFPNMKDTLALNLPSRLSEACKGHTLKPQFGACTGKSDCRFEIEQIVDYSYIHSVFRKTG